MALTVSITDNLPGTATLATANLTYTLIFSDSVTGLSAADFTLSNATLGAISGSGTTWSLSLLPRAGVASGTIGLTLAAGAVTDALGNTNALTSNTTQAIDTKAPVAPKLVTNSDFYALQNPQVTLRTTLGDVVLELDPAKAPVTVANMLAYVDTGFYTGTLFHRVVPGFVVQGGGLTGSVNTGLFNKTPSYGPIVLESNNGLSNTRGSLAMARTSAADSATSQFFVNLVDNNFLNYSSPASPGYAVFGQVVTGMGVIDSMAAQPRLPAPNDSYPQTDIVITSAAQTRAGSSATRAATFSVQGLEAGSAWQYSLDGGASWVTGNGNSFAVPNGNYAANAIQVRQTDAVGNLSQQPGHFTSTLTVETTAPTVTQFTPGDDASKVAVASNLTFSFSEPIARGTGTIALKTLSGAVLESYNAASSGNLTISGNSLTINPTPNLAYGTGYKLDFAAGSITDLAGNAYAGGSGYNFTTTLVNPADPKSAYYELSQKFYLAYFGRAADTGGLNNMAQQLADSGAPTTTLALLQSYDSNLTVKNIIDSFGLSAESRALYGNVSTTAIVTAVYHYILGRSPDAEGLAFWVGAIDTGILSLAKASLSIMEGAEKYVDADGLTVVKKVTVAQNFTTALDTPAEANAYAGNAAALAVRNMLGGVSNSSDTGAYQATVQGTIDQLVATNIGGLGGVGDMALAGVWDGGTFGF